ncbi:hypothetical protein N7516_002142 [Penicillium verrucosum]|uniref:uncharacterized protein n=1 Tax=Penicillium verrucosum TaxID=60171 RepID=UPI0025451731|nr:uncharacterized protein N7516_002142 [Penicillium verrucosum]KAJ5941974.1 hypothetical protein N7516_002142 [Penicillium verrucosum]
MPRPKKTIAFKTVSKSGAPQPEIQADKIYRFPVIEQSLESMKITLHMTIASLLFMRGLLPVDAFGERILRTNRVHECYNYTHFVNGKNKGNFGRNRLEYVPIWVIERHLSDEADQLLDLLENGIFDALIRGVLHAVQFTVLADKDSPNKVLESYTFTFDNFGERGTANRLTNGPRMDFVSPVEDRASMRNMIFEGKALIRRLRTMCAQSPPLPNECSLGIHVFHKPECPGSYDMPGFADSQDNTIEYPRTSYWERTRRFYGSVDSGFHTLGLRVNSLLSTSPGGEAYFPPVEEANDELVLRSDEVGIPTPAQMPLDLVGEIDVSTDESAAGSTDGPTISLDEYLESQYSSFKLAMISYRMRDRESQRYTENKVEDRIFFNQEDLENQQSWVHKKARLQAESVEVDSDDSFEANLVARPPRLGRSRKNRIPLNWPDEETTFPVSRDSVSLSQSRRWTRNDFVPEKYIRRVQIVGSKPTVKASTVYYVENRHGATKKLDEENKDNIENLPGPSDSMTQYGHRDQRHYRCECNTWNFKPRKSIQCANCKDWQHTLCYGYYSAKDARIPDIHYCYSCLIGHEFDNDLMKELIKLTRTRRTIHYVITVGKSHFLNWQLARDLNCSDDEARAAFHIIRKLGIMGSFRVRNENHHKLGHSKFWLNQTMPACHTICSEILDPMLLIGEYYDIPPPNPLPLIRSHWSKSGVPLFSTELSVSGEWDNTIDPRWQPKLWERVRSNPSANGYFFEGETSSSVSKRLLDSKDGEGFEDMVYTREAKKMKFK